MSSRFIFSSTRFKVLKLFLIVCSLFFMTACGGGGGSSTVEPPVTPPTGNEQSQDDQANGEQTDNDQTTPDENALSVITTSGAPAIGVAGGTFSTLEEVVVSPNGVIAFTGTYLLNNKRFNGVWYGPLGNISLVLSTGDSISGVAATTVFSKAVGLRIASSGKLGMRVALSGQYNGVGYAQVTDAGASLLVTPGFSTIAGRNGGTKTIARVDEGYPSTTGVALIVRSMQNQRIFMTQIDGQNKNVIEALSYNELAAQAPRLEGSNCPLDISGATRNPVMLLDNGDLIFEAWVSSLRATLSQCMAQSEAVVRYRNGQYISVVRNRDLIPNSSTGYFAIRGSGATNIISGDADGTVYLQAELRYGTNAPSKNLSLWAFPLSGAPKLMALENEQIQLPSQAGVIELIKSDPASYSRAPLLPCNFSFSSNKLALATPVGKNIAMLVGNIRDGQPHSDISSPGHSALNVIASSDGKVPGETNESVFFNSFSKPYIAKNDNVLFVAHAVNAAKSNEIVDSSLWRSNAQGALSKVLSAGDKVVVEGVDYAIKRSRFGSGIAEDGILFTTNSGGVVTLVTINKPTSNSVFSQRQSLIHLPSAVQ